MTFTHEDQLQYAKLALALFDCEKLSAENIEKILEFGELIKKYSEDNNWVIYDTTEYIHEQLRLLRGEDGAYDDVELHKKLASLVRDL